MRNLLLTIAATVVLLGAGMVWTNSAEARPWGWYGRVYAPPVRYYYRPYYAYPRYYYRAPGYYYGPGVYYRGPGAGVYYRF